MTVWHPMTKKERATWNRKARKHARAFLKQAQRQQKLQSLESDVLNAALAWYRQLVSYTPGHPLVRACAALEKFKTKGQRGRNGR